MILFHFSLLANDQPNFIEGEELYVLAPSGLTLRAMPNKNAQSLTIVEYGSRVIVLSQPESKVHEQIEWVEGKWLLVEYDGIQGYMFDGYLSNLDLPTYDFEFTQSDMELTYPLISWTECKYDIENVDTLTKGNINVLKYNYNNGVVLEKVLSNSYHKIDLVLNDVRVMDAYHLLFSMLSTKNANKIFKDQSIFIEDSLGELSEVKINLESPVKIKKVGDGKVKISIVSSNYLCALE